VYNSDLLLFEAQVAHEKLWFVESLEVYERTDPTLSLVKEALLNGGIIEDYPDDPRGHSCLICGKTESGKFLHIVCGCLYDLVWIITVYEPDPEEWMDPLHRRYEL